jgi:class 3 adenylate cyclase/predicted ATPase
VKFSEIVDQAAELLRARGRISHRALQREFTLDDKDLDDLKEELLFSHPEITEQDGRGLVWVGASLVSGSSLQVSGSKDEDQKQETRNEKLVVSSPPPSSYTPSHLAERIRAVSVSDGERKTITALFADLKGSTALIEGLDPEEARAIIDPALQLMMDAVHRYEGYVAQALGDGIFALFGAPLAHEDHPQRALYAALRMQEEMRRYGDHVRLKHGVPLAMRVGINTGEVVVRSIRKDDLHTDYVPVGHSTNLAARMEQMATPGSILITEYTKKLSDGYFEFKALGAAEIKGVENPLQIYEVLGAGPLRTRLQVSARRGLTRFVGRQSELEQMKQALEQAKAGHGQIVGVMSEPGLGKSRLFYEFVGATHAVPLRAHGCLVLEAYSASHGKASPYLPVIELLKSYFDIQAQDDERRRRERVIGKVLGLDRSLEDTLPYLFALLGIEEQPSPLQQMDPQIRRRRTFDALKKLFLRESLNQPLILIFEDLHWIDSETQGFLDVLSESVASARLLLLTNYRPEYRHEWGSKTYYTQLRLAPFGKAEAEEFLDELLGESKSPLPNGERARVRGMDNNIHALTQLILEKTQGTPFFMEEIVQELVEQGVLVRDAVGARRAVPLPTDLHIPTTVQGVLAARIDRLAPDEKALLQQLSVIGREFPLSLVKQVIPQPEEELYRLLSSLQRKEFLYERLAFPEVEYLFKHALTQEVAYNSVLIERRKALHEQTAQALEAFFRDRLEEHYDELAHHYSRSSNTEKAVEYLQKAGQKAIHRSASVKAIEHIAKALELVKLQPHTLERNQQELALQLALGNVLMATKGYAAPEVGQVYLRARELCHQCGDSVRIFPALFGLWLFYTLREELQTAKEITAQLLDLANKERDPEFLVEAYRAYGVTESHLGNFRSARTALEQALSLYDPQKHSIHAFSYGHDPSIASLNYLAWTLWYLGYPDQAQQRIQEARQRGRELAHPFSLAFALGIGLMLHQLCGEREYVLQWGKEASALHAEQTFPLWESWSKVIQGWTVTESNDVSKGSNLIRQGITDTRATGTELMIPHWLTLLATAYGQAGDTALGLKTIAEALEIVAKSTEAFCEAELHRLKGELTLQQWKVESQKSKVPSPQPLTPNIQAEVEREAEACFLKAIEIAQTQHAKSLELRAVMSLARLWQSQGKHYDARSALSEIYGWFTEGFETKDLQEAKVLLEELEDGV